MRASFTGKSVEWYFQLACLALGIVGAAFASSYVTFRPAFCAVGLGLGLAVFALQWLERRVFRSQTNFTGVFTVMLVMVTVDLMRKRFFSDPGIYPMATLQFVSLFLAAFGATLLGYSRRMARSGSSPSL